MQHTDRACWLGMEVPCGVFTCMHACHVLLICGLAAGWWTAALAPDWADCCLPHRQGTRDDAAGSAPAPLSSATPPFSLKGRVSFDLRHTLCGSAGSLADSSAPLAQGEEGPPSAQGSSSTRGGAAAAAVAAAAAAAAAAGAAAAGAAAAAGTAGAAAGAGAVRASAAAACGAAPRAAGGLCRAHHRACRGRGGRYARRL